MRLCCSCSCKPTRRTFFAILKYWAPSFFVSGAATLLFLRMVGGYSCESFDFVCLLWTTVSGFVAFHTGFVSYMIMALRYHDDRLNELERAPPTRRHDVAATRRRLPHVRMNVEERNAIDHILYREPSP